MAAAPGDDVDDVLCREGEQVARRRVESPVMMPWSCHERFDSDGARVDGVTKEAMTRPTFCPVCTKSDCSMGPPGARPVADAT